MIKSLVGIVFVLANDDVGDRLLVVLRDGLGNSPDLGADEHRQFEGHGLIGNFHFCVANGEFNLWSYKIGVLVDGNLIDGRVIFLLFLLSLLLLFFGSHAHPAIYIIGSCTSDPLNIPSTLSQSHPPFSLDYHLLSVERTIYHYFTSSFR
jgi:hypothetical protein